MKRLVDLSLMLLIGGTAGVAFNFAKSYSHDQFTAEWQCGVVQQSQWWSATSRCEYDQKHQEWMLVDNGKPVRRFRVVSW